VKVDLRALVPISMRVVMIIVMIILPAVHAHRAGAALVVNEVLYDPDGPDADREFVEIMNTGAFAAPLEGLVIESGNGARADDWKIVWTGRPGVSLAPGAVYRVGLDRPGAGEPADLGLQNGPDGVRLSREGFVLDRCGWGDLAHPEYFEGHPARAVRAGMSLSRAEDGVDTGDNAADFVEAAATPGRLNRPRIDWALRLVLDGAWRPNPGDELRVRLHVTNRGREERVPPSVAIDPVGPTIWSGWGEAVPPGSFAEQFVRLTAPADTGRFVWRAKLSGDDDVPENDADSLALRAGPGCVRITEIMADPGSEGCEWIELRIDAPEGQSIAGRELDVRGRRARLAPRMRSPGAPFLLVAEDSSRLLQRYPGLPASAIWPYEGSWPRLRNGDRAGGISDTLLIRDAGGLVEEIALPGPAPSPGVSLERLEDETSEGPRAWVPSSARDGATPGGPGPAGGSISTARGLEVRPRIVRPGSVPCSIGADVGSSPGEVRVKIHDLRGSPVRCILQGVLATGKVLVTWDGRDESGRDVDPGIYVAVLEIERRGGAIDRMRAALAVEPGEAR
jgi:hypothetical protein